MSDHPHRQKEQKDRSYPDPQGADGRDETASRPARTGKTGRWAAITRKTIAHLLANLFFLTILFGALLGGPILMLILVSERLAL